MSETKLRQQTADGSLQQTQAERDSIGICCRLPSENCRLNPLLEATEEVLAEYCSWCKAHGEKRCDDCTKAKLKAAVEKAKGGGK